MADPVSQGVLLAITATSTVGSVYAQTKAGAAQRKAGDAQRRQEALQAAVQRRQQIKAGRQAQALALQAGENQGVSGSSGVAGGVGSIKSQMNSNLSFLDRQTQLADYAGNMFNKAAKWNQTATTLGGVAQLAGAARGYGQDLAAAASAKEEAEKLRKMLT
jgi:hypothetical protein